MEPVVMYFGCPEWKLKSILKKRLKLLFYQIRPTKKAPEKLALFLTSARSAQTEAPPAPSLKSQ
jgi:hypothetical protein